MREDKFLRTLGFEKIAEKSLAKIPPQTLQHLEDTCFGINAYVETLSPSDYPLEFKLLGIEELPTFRTTRHSCFIHNDGLGIAGRMGFRIIFWCRLMNN